MCLVLPICHFLTVWGGDGRLSAIKYIFLSIYTLHYIPAKLFLHQRSFFRRLSSFKKGEKRKHIIIPFVSLPLFVSQISTVFHRSIFPHSPFRRKKTFCGTMKVNYCDLSARTKRWERILTEILFIYSVEGKKNCSMCTFKSRKSS